MKILNFSEKFDEIRLALSNPHGTQDKELYVRNLSSRVPTCLIALWTKK